MKHYFVYILASEKNGTIYIGVTNSLIKRTYIHKNKMSNGFTSKYNVNKLVFYEHYGDVTCAIGREKQLKQWRRKWKIELIEKDNPDWNDLYEEIV